MSQKQNNKVVSFRRPPNGGNIGVVIFVAIFIYIIICVFMYFTQKHIESYQVKMGSLSSNNVYKGIALRDEEIISATKSGYINYYAREGQRVGVGNLVYTIDESGKLADYLNTNGEGTSLTDKDLSELKTEVLGFVNSFDHEEFTSVYDFKNSVQWCRSCRVRISLIILIKSTAPVYRNWYRYVRHRQPVLWYFLQMGMSSYNWKI